MMAGEQDAPQNPANTPPQVQQQQVADNGDAPGVFAKVGDKEFASSEELSAWFDSAEGRAARGLPAEDDPTKPAAEGDNKDAPKDGEDKGSKDKPADDDAAAKAAKVEQIKANLKEAGGVYADPRYEKAAIEFETNDGKLSDETIAETAKAFGVTEDTVKAFIDGEVAKRTLAATQGQAATDAGVQETLKAFGGDAAQYKEFQDWGSEHLTDAQKAAFNKALDDNLPAAHALLAQYKAQWQAQGNGGGPRDLTKEGHPGGGAAASGGVTPFANKEEHDAAFADPRYAKSEAFRQQVAARLKVSPNFN